MNLIIKRLIPITILLLLSGCVHHKGFLLGSSYRHDSYNTRSRGHIYKKDHYYKPRSHSYGRNWWPFAPRHHDYQPEHKYRNKHYQDGYNHYGRGKQSPKYHEHDDRC